MAAGLGSGSLVAGYRLEEQVGAGGMAVVYRAWDERLQRWVALKVLAPGLAADEEFRHRFIQESRAAAAIDDPHIIPVFEAGEAAGMLFIAMRHVPGGDVGTLLRRDGPLSAGRAMAIISPVASALDAAHAAGLVHRDVKPANILVDAGPGRPDHVYLSDFGLSKGIQSAQRLTRSGYFLGTADYSAPEQIQGRALDGRADQYALACTAFELLTGAPPFAKEELTAVVWAHMTAPAPALTSRRPELAPSADAVFATALAKEPGDRYQTCREFAEALREALGLPAYAAAPGTAARRATAPGVTGPHRDDRTVTAAPAKRAWTAPPGPSPRRPDGAPRRLQRRHAAVLIAATAVVMAAGLAAGLIVANPFSSSVARPGHDATVQGPGAWTPTSNGLSLVRYSFRATTLPDGRVLAEGGFAPGSYTPQAEMYDPATSAWTVISPMHQGRGEQSATLLADGRVLVAGGYAGPVLSSAEIFDPATGQWQLTGSMNVNRTRQAAVRLCDGRVLVVGGWNGQGISSAETYDPATGLWTLTAGSLPVPLQNPDAFLLPDCTVLVAGGTAGAGDGTATAAAYIFHPDTGMFAATASMHYPRAGSSGVLLKNGRVLVMGGSTAGSSTTAEEFDPATQQWSEVAPMKDPHTLGFGEDAQLLPDGRVFVPGDSANGLEDELYDPATNTWSFTAPQHTVHYGGVDALLHDGRVLNAGGMNSARTLTPVSETYAP